MPPLSELISGRRAGAASLLLAIFAISLAGAGCRSFRAAPETPRSLSVTSAVRIQSGNVVGSGCLVHAAPRDGAYVLTAAHLLKEPRMVLVHRFRGRDPWRSAEVIAVDQNLDIALLWLPEAGMATPRRLTWARAAPPTGATLELVAAGRSDRPQVVPGKAVGPGRMAPSGPLSEGMSGAGVFHAGSLTGILYGLKVSPGPSEGRYVPLEDLVHFLEPHFGFLRTGEPPMGVHRIGS